MKYLKTILVLLSAFFLMSLIGCSSKYEHIDKNTYVGFKLTSTGWEKDEKGKLVIYHSGVINIGKKDNGTQWQNKLYLLEVGSYLKTEKFTKESEDNDHRLNLSNGTPLTGDIRFRSKLSRTDTAKFEQILSTVEAGRIGQTSKYQITLANVYDKFAQMDNRTGSRSVLGSFKDYEELQELKTDSLPARLFRMGHNTFKTNSVPLTLENVQASNLQRDKNVLEEQNKFAAISLTNAKIDSVGSACRRNGMSYESYYWGQILMDLAEKGKESNSQFIWNIGSAGMPIVKSTKK